MAWTEMAYVHDMGDLLVEPFIHGKQNDLQKHVTCDENLVHIKVVLRTFQFGISKLFQFQYKM